MKSKIFRLDTNSINTTYNKKGDRHLYEFKIELLGAFSIEYCAINLGNLQGYDDNDMIKGGNTAEINSAYNLDDMDCNLIIHYSGIRDYALLFPKVTNQQLKSRLGKFYEESELAFNSGAWLNFMLMCGALFEGILYYKLGTSLTFDRLIKKAKKDGIINSKVEKIMNDVREYRNLVHGNNYNSDYVSRKNAMDTKSTLDKILLNWF